MTKQMISKKVTKNTTTPPAQQTKKNKRNLSDSERYEHVCTAAYFIAKERNFETDPVSCWLEAEKRIESSF